MEDILRAISVLLIEGGRGGTSYMAYCLFQFFQFQIGLLEVEFGAKNEKFDFFLIASPP
jgi:hypothetical protein